MESISLLRHETTGTTQRHSCTEMFESVLFLKNSQGSLVSAKQNREILHVQKSRTSFGTAVSQIRSKTETILQNRFQSYLTTMASHFSL